MADEPIRCPSCGQENPPGTRVCSNCGTALSTEQPLPPEQDPEPAPQPVLDTVQPSGPLGKILTEASAETADATTEAPSAVTETPSTAAGQLAPCPHCGQPVAPDAILCPHCGSRLRSPEEMQESMPHHEHEHEQATLVSALIPEGQPLPRWIPFAGGGLLLLLIIVLFAVFSQGGGSSSPAATPTAAPAQLLAAYLGGVDGVVLHYQQAGDAQIAQGIQAMQQGNSTAASNAFTNAETSYLTASGWLSSLSPPPQYSAYQYYAGQALQLDRNAAADFRLWADQGKYQQFRLATALKQQALTAMQQATERNPGPPK